MKTTTFRNVRISRERVEKALAEFERKYPNSNDYDRWLDKKNYKYAILEKGRCYPPKHILSEVSMVSTKKFSGGDETNDVFRDLCFEIIEKKDCRKGK